jgi:hypothetical protein
MYGSTEGLIPPMDAPTLHSSNALCNAVRLAEVDLLRPSAVYLAEITSTRTPVAANEKRCLAVVPALVDVWASSPLTHRVQTLGLDETINLDELISHSRASSYPRWFALERNRGVKCRD